MLSTEYVCFLEKSLQTFLQQKAASNIHPLFCWLQVPPIYSRASLSLGTQNDDITGAPAALAATAVALQPACCCLGQSETSFSFLDVVSPIHLSGLARGRVA